MYRITLPEIGTFDAWRDAARRALATKVRPEDILWQRGAGAADLRDFVDQLERGVALGLVFGIAGGLGGAGRRRGKAERHDEGEECAFHCAKMRVSPPLFNIRLAANGLLRRVIG